MKTSVLLRQSALTWIESLPSSLSYKYSCFRRQRLSTAFPFQPQQKKCLRRRCNGRLEPDREDGSGTRCRERLRPPLWRPGYEDWCLLDGSWALDPLNAFAVAGSVTSAHDAAAAQMEEGHGRALLFGLGRTRFAGTLYDRLADAAARHSMAHSSRRAAPTTPGSDIMAASNGTRARQGVCAYCSGGSPGLCPLRLDSADHR